MIPRKNEYPARHRAGVVKNRKAECASPKGLSCFISPSLFKPFSLAFIYIIIHTLHTISPLPFITISLASRSRSAQRSTPPKRFKIYPKRSPVNIVLSSYFIAFHFAYSLPFFTILCFRYHSKRSKSTVFSSYFR